MSLACPAGAGELLAEGSDIKRRRPENPLPLCGPGSNVKVGLKILDLPLNLRERPMIGPTILADYRAQLARQVAARPRIPPFEPLPITVWIAMSGLQKAIRRGRTGLALQAAATLLLNSPDRLWRRCGTIAFEDIGVADLEVVGLVTAALGGKPVRASLGGEWSVASLIVETMAASRKCRAADDMLMGIERHPNLADARQVQAGLSMHQLRRIVLSSAPLPERALALWYVLGTDRRPSHHLATRRGEPAFVFDLLDELGTPMTVVEIAREGFRRTREVLCLFVGLLMANGQPAQTATTDDDFPPETVIGPVPSWALDMFTREGRQAFSRFLAGESDTARWVRAHVPRDERVSFLGNLVFFAEGGLLRSRLRWPVSDELRRQAEIESQGPHCRDAAEVLALLRRDLTLLNEERARVR